MSNFVYIATSLDGFIATKSGGLEWLFEIPNPDGSDFGFAEFMGGIDAIVMGRNTFETVLTFDSWPYNKPVFVLSNSLKSIPPGLSGKIEILRGEPRYLVEQLNSRNLINLYIDGGKTIQAFIEQDLIDELILTRIPVLLGAGIPLFSENSKELKFEHIKTEVLNNTIVKSHYRRKLHETISY